MPTDMSSISRIKGKRAETMAAVVKTTSTNECTTFFFLAVRVAKIIGSLSNMQIAAQAHRHIREHTHVLSYHRLGKEN